MKFLLQDIKKRKSPLTIELNDLALLAWNGPAIAAITVDLQEDAPIIVSETGIGSFNFIMNGLTLMIFTVEISN